jgi:nicotinate-nucleotide adenylyltransferase
VKERVAVFGGSFNPPHVAHVLAVTLVLSAHPIDRVLVVPAYQHPFAKQLAPFEDRAKMAELAMAWIPNVFVSRVEEELGGESRTLRTLEHLKKTHPDWDLRLVIGADILLEAHKWHGFAEIQKLAPLLVLGRSQPKRSGGTTAAPTTRGGAETARYEADTAPLPLLPEISSTEVRAKCGEGKHGELSGLVPLDVLEYIRAKGLYTT